VRVVVVALLTAVLVHSAGSSGAAQTRIKTPFQVISLWSEEMLDYIVGTRQQACSGANAAKCERIDSGVCDGIANIAFKPGFVEPLGRTEAARQREAAKPQIFSVGITNAVYRETLGHHQWDDGLLELVFDCNISGNDVCPAGRFQIGRLHRLDVAPIGDLKNVFTPETRVDTEGKIVISLDPVLRKKISADSSPFYHVRVVAECFTVKPVPIEWKFPLHEGPSARAKSPGNLIVRVSAGSHADFIYQRSDGSEVPFEPDWTEPDWGYTYLMEQTILDRQGDWAQVPRRPFPQPVWIRMPSVPTRAGEAKPGISRLEVGETYELSKTVRARRRGATRSTVFKPGPVIVVGIKGAVIEIRREESFDSPCSDDHNPAKSVDRPTYLVDAEELYDADLHLKLHPAYTRGC
jgi:hypothetical protein